eukprot:2429354-Amphidinium_carterae.1
MEWHSEQNADLLGSFAVILTVVAQEIKIGPEYKWTDGKGNDWKCVAKWMQTKSGGELHIARQGIEIIIAIEGCFQTCACAQGATKSGVLWAAQLNHVPFHTRLVAGKLEDGHSSCTQQRGDSFLFRLLRVHCSREDHHLVDKVDGSKLEFTLSNPQYEASWGRSFVRKS